MTEIDLNLVCELVAQDKGDVTIAERFAVTRHAARKLIEQAKVELARRERRGEVQSSDVIIVDPEPETILEFVEAIKKCLRKSVDGFIEAGRHLAKAKIKHRGEFVQMVERDLGMSARMAQQLMAISQDERFANHGSYLPTTWRTLYELTRLDDEEFERGIESGVINPTMEREDAIRLKNPAAAPPEGEGPPAADHPVGSSPAAAVPPHQESVAEPAHPARGPSIGDDPAGDSGSDQGKQEGTADDRDSRGRHGPQPSSFPPHQESGIREQESESEVMDSEATELAPRGTGTRPDDTPPRPAVSEPGGAEKSNTMPIEEAAEGLRAQYLPESKPAWNASRITPPDDLDFYPTGPWITRTLFERVLPQVGVRRVQRVWEPACGEGHMAEVIQEYAHSVHASDIHNYGYGEIWDFLQTDTYYTDCENIDWIITNPPYNGRALDFALRALDLAGEGVALFTSVQWIAEGKERYERLFRDRPPTLIAFFIERAPVHEKRWLPNGDTKQAYCWVVWRKNHRPKAPFWIPPGCRESLTKPDDAERFTAHPVKRKEFPPLDMGHHPEAAESDRNAGPCQPAASSLRSGEMPDMPGFLDRRKEQTESN